MSSKATLFLIDGSSQMYRAYHAIRGLSGPDGKSTNAVYGFVTMLRKLLTDHQPDVHRGVVRSARADVPRRSWSPTTRRIAPPMPADLAEQIPWVHEACEALGVPIITAEGFEADDVIGTLAAQAPCRRATTSRSSPATRISFSSSATASASSTRATRAPGTTPTGVREKFGVGPSRSSTCSR